MGSVCHCWYERIVLTDELDHGSRMGIRRPHRRAMPGIATIETQAGAAVNPASLAAHRNRPQNCSGYTSEQYVFYYGRGTLAGCRRRRRSDRRGTRPIDMYRVHAAFLVNGQGPKGGAIRLRLRQGPCVLARRLARRQHGRGPPATCGWWMEKTNVPVEPTREIYLVDPASSHTLVSKIKPCTSLFAPGSSVVLHVRVNREWLSSSVSVP